MGKVLIIGAGGMLGQALVRAFRDWEVVAWDREECDITDRVAVMQKIVDPYTVIINAAAYNDVDGAEKNADVASRVNGDAVGYLAEAAAKIGATFVHYSTDYVFDGTKKEGYREDETPNPISKYGQSKFLGEQHITHYALPITHYVIRTSRLFGKQGNGKKSFVDLMLDRVQKFEVELPKGSSTSPFIEIVDEEFSSPTYVEDLAQRTREIIEQKKPSGVYHVTNSGACPVRSRPAEGTATAASGRPASNGACTWYDFAQEIFQQYFEVGPHKGGPTSEHRKMPMITPVPASRFPRPAKRPAYSQLLNTKLPPMRPWQEALREYLTHDLRRV